VRVFPVPSYSERYDGPRVDFRETVLWMPQVKTDKSGAASVELYLSDAVTSFRAVAEGVSAGGQLGRGEALIQSKLPVSLAVKMPLEVSAGDVVELPVTVANETDEPYTAALTAEFGPAFKRVGVRQPDTLELAPRARRSLFFELEVVGDGEGDSAEDARAAGKARIAVEAANLRDEVERNIKVVPRGFPVEISASGTLERTARHEIDVSDAIAGTLRATVTMYPSPLATMVQGTEAIIREPTGCFEQASSANYPNIMILGYLQEYDAADPDLVARTHGVLERGYGKLAGYESPSKGYEWFGGDPGHEALTAYGLMEFIDMTRVYDDVDQGMIDRTARWLEARRDGKGGYQRSSQALDSFGRASEPVTDAYITYALARAGRADKIAKEINRSAKVARETEDPYVLALAAGALVEARHADAKLALRRLAAKQADDGSLPGAEHSITRSGGVALSIETTALAALAFMSARGKVHGDYEAATRKAIEWLNGNRDGFGGYGSTQSTVLALDAMRTHAAQSKRAPAAGVITVSVNGAQVGRVEFEAGHEGAIEIDVSERLKPGENAVELTLDSESPLPYSALVTYGSTKPPTSPEAPVRIATALARSRVPMGESVRMDVRVSNITDKGIPMTLARVGLPGGLSFQTWQLKELRDKKLIDFYETREREVILYFRSLPPKADKRIPLELTARVPGRYTAPASRAYLYYTDEHQLWAPPVRIAIGESARG
jgi:uncharacterized protein YfaS (alpha-2-macroglobulin family)